MLGVSTTTIYNPLSAKLRDQSTRLEAELFGRDTGFRTPGADFWVRQRSDDGQSVINAKSSRQQGVQLGGVTVFRFDHGRSLPRPHRGQERDARSRDSGGSTRPASTPAEHARTTATAFAQDQSDARPGRESFATPETVPFWQLSLLYRARRECRLAAAGYRLQYYQLSGAAVLSWPMVLLAASVSLRFFRLGGVQKVVLGGVGAGFLLYVLAKVTGDLSKAGLMPPMVAAALPPSPSVGDRLIALLYQEDG